MRNADCVINAIDTMQGTMHAMQQTSQVQHTKQTQLMQERHSTNATDEADARDAKYTCSKFPTPHSVFCKIHLPFTVHIYITFNTYEL